PFFQQLAYPPATCPVFDAGIDITSCNAYAGSGIHYRRTNNSTGITKQNTISISPNPASDFVQVAWGQQADLAKDQAAIIITDMLGRQVLRASAAETNGVESKFSLST